MFVDLSLAGARVVAAIAQALAPAPDMRISDWVDQGKVVLSAKTNTPRPGQFSFDGVEYLREPLDRLHPDDPASRVTIRGGAQTGKSSVGQLWMCWSIDCKPMSFAVGLPTGGEVVKYNDYKLDPLLEDSPALKPKVRPVSVKAREGSNTKKKRLYNGATILLFNLGSAAELQMISTGNLILEEVANTKKEIGTRGSPIKQARERQAAYSVVGSKELMVSTGGEAGECEVTKGWLAGDRRLFYGECQHCRGFFPITPENFAPADPQWGVCVPCPGCGSPLHDKDRAAWRKPGRWIPTFPAADSEANPSPPAYLPAEDLQRWIDRDCEGLEPSYQVWQAMCGLIALDSVAEKVTSARTPEDFKALDQQVYGRDYDPAIEALSFEEVHRLREDYDHGVVPEWAEILTGFCDVQGSYLEWGVLAWGPGAEWRVVERDVIAGDTSGPECWAQLDEVTRRSYPHEAGGVIAIEAFGVDTGFRTQKVYAFARGRPNVYAMDGRPGWKLPLLGKAKAVKVVENGRVKGRVKLWPTGTWELKSLLLWSLKVSIEAGYNVRLQGRGHWSKAEDEAWAKQITAETLHEEKNAKTGETDRWWKVITDRRNEWVDIWVGARALAYSLGVGAARKDRQPGEMADWERRARSRLETAGETPPADLFARRAAAPAPALDTPPPPRERRLFKPKR